MRTLLEVPNHLARQVCTLGLENQRRVLAASSEQPSPKRLIALSLLGLLMQLLLGQLAQPSPKRLIQPSVDRLMQPSSVAAMGFEAAMWQASEAQLSTLAAMGFEAAMWQASEAEL